ncbi:Ovarian tumor otubain [Penicillium expansum]|nr:Ovarian tumor otubain [Penicillium expansum]
MRIRVRGPSGQSTITLDDTATIKDLLTQIAEKTGLATFDVKYGYPLKPLELDSFQQDQRILEVGINLNGESLIVAQKEGATRGVSDDAPTARTVPSQPAQPSQPSRSQIPPENTTEDPPEIASPEHAGTFVLRVMPDDNSCLFRAVGAAIMGDMDTMVELRSIIAGAIQSNPSEYTAAILGKKPDEYCTWIQNEDSWVAPSSSRFSFNEGAPTRCIVVYSGIHYDVLALSPSRPPYTRANPLPHGDTKIFEAVDPVVLQKAKELCRVLQGKHYYTDTSGFTVRCNVCGGTFTGERGATKHAAETGHYDFGEAS